MVQEPILHSWTVMLDKGQTIIADLYIATTFVMRNNEFFPPELLDGNGWLRVDEELRAMGKHESAPLPVYAAGDITKRAGLYVMGGG